MRDAAVLPAVERSHPRTLARPNPYQRVRGGMRHRRNWLQLARFAVVGAAGYAVNLTTYVLCIHAAGVDYRAAAVIAWVVSVINNFLLNRLWTFAIRGTNVFGQWVRFVLVSAVAFGLSYVALIALVGVAGLPKILAQAIAVALATPLNFVGQKLWTFAPRVHRRARRRRQLRQAS